MNKKHYLHLGTINFILILLSCGLRSSSEDSLVNQANVKINIPKLKKPKADGSTLILTKFVTGLQYCDKISTKSCGYADMETNSETDYIEFELCTPKADSSGECKKEKKVKSTLYVSFPPYPDGVVVAKARACIEESRATDPANNCGAWKESSYSLNNSTDPRIATLIQEKEAILTQIEDKKSEIKEILARLSEELAQCTTKKSEAERVTRMREVVGSLIQIGETTLSGMLKNYNKEVAEKEAKRLAEKDKQTKATVEKCNSGEMTDDIICQQSIRDNIAITNKVGAANDDKKPTNDANIKDAKSTFDKFKDSIDIEKYRVQAEKLSTGSQQAGQSQPLTALQAVGGAIFDIVNADKTAGVPCNLDKSKPLSSAISMEISLMAGRLIYIDKQIELLSK